MHPSQPTSAVHACLAAAAVVHEVLYCARASPKRETCIHYVAYAYKRDVSLFVAHEKRGALRPCPLPTLNVVNAQLSPPARTPGNCGEQHATLLEPAANSSSVALARNRAGVDSVPPLHHVTLRASALVGTSVAPAPDRGGNNSALPVQHVTLRALTAGGTSVCYH